MIIQTADLKSIFHNMKQFKENEPGYLDIFIYSECIRIQITTFHDYLCIHRNDKGKLYLFLDVT
mgnify:FL=1